MLVEQLTRNQYVKQRVWRFLMERFDIQELNEVKWAYFSAFVDWRLEAGASGKSVNADLRTFHGFLDFLQGQGLPVPHALLRLKCLKEPEPLPKFLTDNQKRRTTPHIAGMPCWTGLVFTCSGRLDYSTARWKICARKTWKGVDGPCGGAKACSTGRCFSPIQW